MDEKEIDEILKEINSRKIESGFGEEYNQEPAEEIVFSLPNEASTEEKQLESEASESETESLPTEEIIQDDLSQGVKRDFYFADYSDDGYEEVEENKSTKNKRIAIALAIVCAIIAIGVGVFFGFFYDKGVEEPDNKAEPVVTVEETTVDNSPKNPLTGERGFNESALDKRPVAVVVENEYSTSAVKPQWGLSEADIVLEGESEFSTRMLFFYADYTNMPKQIGPTRSARPPFIRFSQLFDAVFIHAGLSHSGGGYVGADDVFVNENIDHINLLSLSEGGYFGRDYSRTKTVEHTGFLNGENVAELLNEKKINTTLNPSKFTALEFNEQAKKLSNNSALKVGFEWSSRCPKKAVFEYDQAEHRYITSDFDSQFGNSDAGWENLIFLLDETRYVVKENYKGSGKSETYCDYLLSGGKGMLCSEGTSIDITWGVSDKKLWIKDTNGNNLSLNPGKTYIGYGSSNHAGVYSIITQDQSNN